MRGRDRWRRVLRGAGWVVPSLLALVLVLVLLSLALVNTRWGERWLKDKIVAQARQTVPGLSVGKLGGFLPFSIELRDVEIRDAEGLPAVRIARVYIDPVLRSLLSREIDLHTVEVDSPSVKAVQQRGGQWNVSQLLKRRPEPAAKIEESAWDFKVHELRVSGGRISVTPAAGNASTLSQLKLQGRATYRDGDLDAAVSAFSTAYELLGNQGSLSASARAHVDPQRVEAHLDSRFSGVRARPVSVLVEAAGPPRDIRGRVEIERERERLFSARARVSVPARTYAVRANLNRLDPSAIMASLPRGEVTLWLRAEGQGVPLEQGSTLALRLGSPGITVGQAQVQKVVLDLSARGERWRLQPLEVQSAGARLRAEGGGTLREFAVRSELDAPKVGPLSWSGKRLLLDGGRVRASFRGNPAGELTLEGAAQIQRLVYGESTLQGFAATVDGRARPRAGTGRFAFRTQRELLVNRTRLREVHLRAQADGRTLRVEGSATPTTSRGRRLRAAQLSASLPLERGALRLARRRPMHLRAEWTGVPVQALTELVGSSLPLSGELSVRAQAAGSLAAPRGKAVVLLDRGQYRELGRLRAELAVDATPVSTQARFAARSGPTLLVEGRARTVGLAKLLPLRRGERQPLEANVRVPSVPTARLLAFAPALRSVNGRVNGWLRASGSLVDPRLEAFFELARPQAGREPVRVAASLEGDVRGGRSRLRAEVRLQDAAALRLVASAPITPAQLLRGSPRPAQIEARGTIGPIAVHPLGRLSTELAEVRGQLSGSFTLEASSRSVTGNLRLRGDGLGVGYQDLGELRASGDLKSRSAALDASITQRGGQGRIRVSLDERGEARATLVATHLDLGAMRRIWRAAPLADDWVTGQLMLQARVTGPPPVRGRPPSLVQRLQSPEEIRGRVQVKGAQLALYLRPPERPEQPKAATEPAGEPVKPARISRQLRRGVAFRLDRLAVSESRIRLVDASLPARPSLQLTEVAVTLENLASRRSLMNGVPAVLTFRSRVEGSGVMVAFATFDPLADRPLAAGRASIRDLKLASLNDFLEGALQVKAPEGTFSCYAAFRLRGDQISGGIKPIISNPTIEPAESASWLKSLGVQAADVLADLATDDVPGREGIATVIPIKGTIQDPDVQLLPAVLGVIRNAFVVGLASGFTRLPPLTAKSPQSIFAQAAQALMPSSGIKAQPSEKGAR